MKITVGGRSVLLDDDSAPAIAGRRLCVGVRGKNRKREYVCVYEGKKYLGMLHRLIVGNAAAGLDVDHINHNALDNRKENLRVCTRSQNLMNARGRVGRKFDLPKGVCKRTDCDRYYASITVRGRRITAHGFTTPEAAAIEYARLSALHHGEFGCLT